MWNELCIGVEGIVILIIIQVMVIILKIQKKRDQMFLVIDLFVFIVEFMFKPVSV